MRAHTRRRFALVGGLVAAAVVLAGITVAMGVPAPLDGEDGVRFNVSDGTVNVTESGQEITVVDDLSNVTEVEIEASAPGEFTVSTGRDSSLSPSDRDRARSIARENETVAAAIESLSAVRLAVDPVYRVRADSVQQVDIGDSTNLSDNVSAIKFESSSIESTNSGVVIRSDREPVPGEAVVRVLDPTAPADADLRYSVDIDLDAGRVTDITDWTEIETEVSIPERFDTRNSSVRIDD